MNVTLLCKQFITYTAFDFIEDDDMLFHRR